MQYKALRSLYTCGPGCAIKYLHLSVFRPGWCCAYAARCFFGGKRSPLGFVSIRHRVHKKRWRCRGAASLRN